MSELTHIDEDGAARMVDVGPKPETARCAVARCEVVFPDAATLTAVLEASGPKGEVLATARIAAIQGAKRTSDLIPLCHPLRLDGVEIAFDSDLERCLLEITATVRCHDRTGVEMEALVAATTAGLVVYDMSKALARGTELRRCRLLSKTGGQRGDWKAPE